MARKCEDWLLKFNDWASPRSESPVTFMFGAGLFCLAAAVRKHVYIPKSIMGSYDIYPNVYIVLVGPPGGPRKTTTMSFADDLLHSLGKDLLPAAPTMVTQAALMTEMVESPDGTLYITASELASLIQKSKMDMFEFLTDAYDTRKPIRARTIGRGIEEVEKPCLNIMACTQPAWIAENMPASVIGGGFAARTIFIYEDEGRRVQLYYRELNHDVLEEYKRDLVEDLAHIACIEGEFDIDEEAEIFMEDWNRVNQEQIKHRDPNVQSYYIRKSQHAHKIAMLTSLSYKDELVLTKYDFEYALNVLGLLEKNMPKVFANVGKNEYSIDIDSIREYVKTRKRVERSLVWRTFQANAQPAVFDSLITALKLMGDIEEVSIDSVTYYTVVE